MSIRPITCLLITSFLTVCGGKSALAIPSFFKQFQEAFVKEEDKAFVELVSTTKCTICHIKGQKKTERNAYGQELAKLLKKNNFSETRLKTDAENAKKEILAAFEKVGAMKSDGEKADSPTFGQQIAKGLLPGVTGQAPPKQEVATAKFAGDTDQLFAALIASIKATLP